MGSDFFTSNVDEGSASDAVVVVEYLDPLLLRTEVIQNDLRVGLDLNVQKEVNIYDPDLYIEIETKTKTQEHLD